MRKSFILLVSVLVLAACSVQNNNTTSSSLSTSSSSVLPSGKMDQSQIEEPQVGGISVVGQSRMEKIPILSKSQLESCLKTPIV